MNLKTIELPEDKKFHLAYAMCKSKVARKILDCLEKYGELNVTQIHIKTRKQRSVISFYIRKLECLGIVKATQLGKKRYYELTMVNVPDRLKELAISI